MVYISWEQDIFDAMGGLLPRVDNCTIGYVTATKPTIKVKVRDLVYEGHTLYIANHLLKHKRKIDLILKDPMLHADPQDKTEHKNIYKAVLQACKWLKKGDLVFCVQIEDKQRLVVLEKIKKQSGCCCCGSIVIEEEEEDNVDDYDDE